MMWNRREWICGAGFSIASAIGQPRLLGGETVDVRSEPKAGSTGFFHAQAFGAHADGVSSDTIALQSAIDSAARSGGGTVYLPAGRYLAGTLHLRSYVSLWLDNGAVLVMSPNPSDFTGLTQPAVAQNQKESNEETSALLLGCNLDSVTIAGEGAIEGNRIRRGGPKPIFLQDCRDVSIGGIRLRNAPNYNLSLFGCQRVVINAVTIQNGFADGIDLDCCRHVRLSNCFVESIDDAICLKATRSSGDFASTEQVAISNCVLRTASVHFKCGTESCGDFRDIVVTNCAFEGSTRFRHGNPGIGLYTVDGGSLTDVTISNIAMRNVGTAFAMLVGNRDAWGLGRGAGKLAAVRISNIVASGVQFPSVCAGLPDAPITGLYLEDIAISMDEQKVIPEGSGEVPEVPKHYPEPTMFGPLPAFGLFLRHLVQVKIRDVRIVNNRPSSDIAIAADDLDELLLSLTTGSKDASVWLQNIRHSFVDAVVLAQDTESRYRVSGSRSVHISFRIAGAKDASGKILLDPDLPPEAVQRL